MVDDVAEYEEACTTPNTNLYIVKCANILERALRPSDHVHVRQKKKQKIKVADIIYDVNLSPNLISARSFNSLI